MALAGGATTTACLLLLVALVRAASPAPAPSVDCTTAILGLSDCLDYVSPNSKSTIPSKTCCGEVNKAVSSPAVIDCLCSALSSGKPPIEINMTRVLALPAACGASASAFSKCHVLPGGAPTEAPSPSAGAPASGSGTASPPKAAAARARSPVTTTILLAAVAAPLLMFYYL